MEEYAQTVSNFGVLKGRIEIGNIEMSLYHYNGMRIEIFFNIMENKITKIEQVENKAINPYIKYLMTNINN